MVAPRQVPSPTGVANVPGLSEATRHELARQASQLPKVIRYFDDYDEVERSIRAAEPEWRIRLNGSTSVFRVGLLEPAHRDLLHALAVVGLPSAPKGTPRRAWPLAAHPALLENTAEAAVQGPVVGLPSPDGARATRPPMSRRSPQPRRCCVQWRASNGSAGPRTTCTRCGASIIRSRHPKRARSKTDGDALVRGAARHQRALRGPHAALTDNPEHALARPSRRGHAVLIIYGFRRSRSRSSTPRTFGSGPGRTSIHTDRRRPGPLRQAAQVPNQGYSPVGCGAPGRRSAAWMRTRSDPEIASICDRPRSLFGCLRRTSAGDHPLRHPDHRRAAYPLRHAPHRRAAPRRHRRQPADHRRVPDP